MPDHPYDRPSDPAKRHSAALTDGPDRAAARAMLKAIGFSDEDLGRGQEPFDLAGVLITSRRHLLIALTAEEVVDDALRALALRTLAERLPPIG